MNKLMASCVTCGQYILPDPVVSFWKWSRNYPDHAHERTFSTPQPARRARSIIAGLNSRNQYMRYGLTPPKP